MNSAHLTSCGAQDDDDLRGYGKVPVQGRISVNDLLVGREAIVAGLGIGALPWFLAAPDLAAGRIVRALPEPKPRARET